MLNTPKIGKTPIPYQVFIVVCVFEYELAHHDIDGVAGVVGGEIIHLPHDDVDQDVKVVGVKQVAAVLVAKHVHYHLQTDGNTISPP